ncbi:GSCFA domain-containing protein [Aquimarina sp. 2201CG1-2-11]|uniref:GSCFA domain-containing protein n=1 Tax=Aquimarina discodermiae TaxID=3231043 RepID=UPI0034620BE9
MNLQTKIPLQPKEPQIDYTSGILSLGSCFAENIGEKLSQYKFRNDINPFGILFHPKAIETFLWMATQDEKYTETDLFFMNERWHCFDAHSSLSSTDKNTLRNHLNKKLAVTKAKIQTSSHVIITLGTAWVYRLKALDMIVANCHKIPQKEFQKELLSVNEVVQCLQNCIHLVRAINPSVQFIFTVSPVRHSKDGFVENTRSKSHLFTAIHHVIDKIKGASYFPAYEIMMDELRDYRFYNEDMIHPSKLAIQYIWECFIEVWISKEATQIMNKVEEIVKGISHKPFNPQSVAYQKFLKKLELKKEQLTREHPHMSWDQ